MTEIVKSDIFFFITGGSIILVTLGLLVAIYYIVKILRDVEDITEHVRGESENIVYDVSYVRKMMEKAAKHIKKIIRPSSRKTKKKK